MNGKAQVFFVTMMIALVFIILALAFAPSIKVFVDDAMGPTTDTSVGLNCEDSTISNFDKANCLFVDYFIPLFTGFLLFSAGLVIKAKLQGEI